MTKPFARFPSHHCPRGILICVSLLRYCNCRVPADACCFLQVPGKEFTRTCKGLVVMLIGGYVLLQLLPSSLNYLAIIPSKSVLAWILDTQRNNLFRIKQYISKLPGVLQDNPVCMDCLHGWLHRTSPSRGELNSSQIVGCPSCVSSCFPLPGYLSE